MNHRNSPSFDCIRSRPGWPAGPADPVVLVGDGTDEILVGGRGDDVIHGGGGSNILYGGAGNDLLDVRWLTYPDKAQVPGGFEAWSAAKRLSVDFMHGGNGDDVLEGSFGKDRLSVASARIRCAARTAMT